MHLLAALVALTLACRRVAGHGEANAVWKKSVSMALFSDLEEFSRLVDVSYCTSIFTGGISKPFNCWGRCDDFRHCELVKDWRTGLSTHSDSGGYLALDHHNARITVAFRGTINLAGMVADFRISPQEYTPFLGAEDQTTGRTIVGRRDPHEESAPSCSDCTVHTGFSRVWNNTRYHIEDAVAEQVAQYPEYELHLVGHSLGAAVAALAALDFNARQWEPYITTFGEPRIGNDAMNKHIDDTFDLIQNQETYATYDQRKLRWRRVTKTNDPIPLLPPTEWGFSMHAGEIYISKSSLPPTVQDFQLCEGPSDKECIAGQDPSYPHKLETASLKEKGVWATLKQDVPKALARMLKWDLPHRYRFWHVLISHRDYFWRLGLCVPGGDPTGGGGHMPELAEWRAKHGMTIESGSKAEAAQDVEKEANDELESNTGEDAEKEL